MKLEKPAKGNEGLLVRQQVVMRDTCIVPQEQDDLACGGSRPLVSLLRFCVSQA